MEVVIIGSGNVAEALGKKLLNAGHTILQIFSRNAARASLLAYDFDCESINYYSLINKNADLYIIAVSDAAISEVSQNIDLGAKPVVHTAAAVSVEALKKSSTNYGVLYPLQTIRQGGDAGAEIPFFYDGNSEAIKTMLHNLIITLSPHAPTAANDDERLKLHLGAVFVNNFVNHLYAAAQSYCEKEGLDFTHLLPLIDETTTKIKTIPARQSQTGPASRNDEPTIQKHLQMLESYPQLKELYLILTQSIRQAGNDYLTIS